MSFSAMAEDQVETNPTFPLLDLPDAALSIIIAGLEDSDKKMIMAACEQLLDMTMLNAEITLKVAKGSKFAGFKKVLESTSPANVHLQIMCPPDAGQNINADQNVPSSTMVVLMSMVPDNTLTQLAASCQGKAWEHITKVTIQGSMMRCLVPRFIVLTCPQLMQLYINRASDKASDTHLFHTDPDEALPLTLCTSLKHLEIDDPHQKLPSAYHSPAELRRHLPNIDTLIFPTDHNACLIQAFATQLTRLEINWYGEYNELQQVVRPCHNLQHLCVPALALPDSTAKLKFVELVDHVGDGGIWDGGMQQLLQLSSLTELRVPHLKYIQQDWSHHACSWQELHLSDELHFIKLANINLRSLKKLSVGPEVEIHLPDPSNPSSLPVVQHVAASLSHGHIVVTQNTEKHSLDFAKSSIMRWHIPDCGSEHEQTAAELIRVAAQRIGPCHHCICEALLHRPLPLAALLQWGQTFIESVILGRNHDPMPYVWQALRELKRLNSVMYWMLAEQRHQSDSKGYDDETLNMSKVISSAAQHYVIPANRSLRIEYEDFNLDPSEVEVHREWIGAVIQDVLPAGCKLASVQYTCVEGSFYAIWVAVVEPCHSTT